jgi:signal transduction histidine kinase
VSIAVPVLRQDVVRWVLDGRLDTTRFTRVITSGLQESTAALVLDREMLIVARTPDLERHFDTLLAGDLRRALLESPLQGAIRVPADGGGSVIAAWKRVPVGWAVVVSEPTAIRDEPLRQSIARMAFAGSAVLGLGILMSLVVGQRVAQAVHAVGADAHTLAQGGRVEHRSSPILEIASMYEALETASESLHQTALAREEATRALQEADRRKDEFLAMLAHELRNPLAPLRNAVSLLGRSVLPDTGPGQAVAMCERQLRHMTRLVNDLLDVSRITQGKIELRRERMLLGDAVQDAIDSLQAAIEGQHQQLRVHLPAEPVPIDADRVRLTQVVENLLSNASKYTDAKGWIDVRVELDGPDVLIHVCDNGIGIAPEKLSHVFDLFAQIDTAMDRAQGGLGIGLSLVRSLVELHGGTVIVTSGGLGKGACFVVRLPQFAPAPAA